MNLMLELMSGFYLVPRLYEKKFTALREKYGVTQLEIDILAFLKNNPALDTASDMVRYRMLPKANVSQAVELLIQKNMLRRVPDQRDRRKIHLLLAPGSDTLLEEILIVQESFMETLFLGLSETEREYFMEVSRRVACNVKQDFIEDGGTANHGTEE